MHFGDVKHKHVTSPEATTGEKLVGPVTDKKGYGERWRFSVRHVDNFIGMGMPHLKIGERRVRIIISEADQWMRDRFSTRRRKPLTSPSTASDVKTSEVAQ